MPSAHNNDNPGSINSNNEHHATLTEFNGSESTVIPLKDTVPDQEDCSLRNVIPEQSQIKIDTDNEKGMFVYSGYIGEGLNITDLG